MKNRYIAIVALLFSILSVSPASAGPSTDAIREANDSIQEILRLSKQDSAQAAVLEARLAKEVRSILDVSEVARRALRDHAKSLSKQQLKDFQTLLGALIEQSYAKALQSRVSYEVDYLGEQDLKSGGATNKEVQTKVRTSRRGRPYTVMVDYQMHVEGGQWRAYDVITDGVSLVRNYRAQFNRIIAKEGFEGLIARMEKRQSEFGAR